MYNINNSYLYYKTQIIIIMRMFIVPFYSSWLYIVASYYDYTKSKYLYRYHKTQLISYDTSCQSVHLSTLMCPFHESRCERYST